MLRVTVVMQQVNREDTDSGVVIGCKKTSIWTQLSFPDLGTYGLKWGHARAELAPIDPGKP